MKDDFREPVFGRALIGGFSFALLACFAFISLLIVLMSARVYRRVESASLVTNQTRTTLCYIAGKVRATDASGSVKLTQINGLDALVLQETYGQDAYNTYIYYDGSAVCECFARADRGLNPNLSDRLIEVPELSLSMEGRLLTIAVKSDQGDTVSMAVLLQSASEGGPA